MKIVFQGAPASGINSGLYKDAKELIRVAQVADQQLRSLDQSAVDINSQPNCVLVERLVSTQVDLELSQLGRVHPERFQGTRTNDRLEVRYDLNGMGIWLERDKRGDGEHYRLRDWRGPLLSVHSQTSGAITVTTPEGATPTVQYQRGLPTIDQVFDSADPTQIGPQAHAYWEAKALVDKAVFEAKALSELDGSTKDLSPALGTVIKAYTGVHPGESTEEFLTFEPQSQKILNFTQCQSGGTFRRYSDNDGLPQFENLNQKVETLPQGGLRYQGFDAIAVNPDLNRKFENPTTVQVKNWMKDRLWDTLTNPTSVGLALGVTIGAVSAAMSVAAPAATGVLALPGAALGALFTHLQRTAREPHPLEEVGAHLIPDAKQAAAIFNSCPTGQITQAPVPQNGQHYTPKEVQDFLAQASSPWQTANLLVEQIDPRGAGVMVIPTVTNALCSPHKQFDRCYMLYVDCGRDPNSLYLGEQKVPYSSIKSMSIRQLPALP